MIKGLTPQLMQMGAIKIGMKGDQRQAKSGGTYRMPTKIDHFLITTMQREGGKDDGNYLPDYDLMEKIKASSGQDGGAKLNDAGNIIELPIRLLYNDVDLNFFTRYAAYDGRTCFCSGDGERAVRQGVEQACPCNLLGSTQRNQPTCKPNGVLTCLLDGSDRLGGCYKFRTTSWNSITSILGSLKLLEATTRGNMAFVPLHLVIQPKTAVIPNTTKTTTIHVVSVVFRGNVSQLHEITMETARKNAVYHQRMEQIEVYARKQIEADGFYAGSGEGRADNDADIADEFYPQIPADAGVADDENKEPQGNLYQAESVEDLKAESEITEAGGFTVGAEVWYPMGKDINGGTEIEIVNAKCRIVRFTDDKTAEIEVIEDVEFKGKKVKGVKTKKPVADFLRERPAIDADSMPEAEAETEAKPETIEELREKLGKLSAKKRKDAAKKLGLDSDMPDTEEEIKALLAAAGGKGGL